jgi:hypothetical protein
MTNIIERLEWIIDFYFVYFLYNPNKIDRYVQYMTEKWDIESGVNRSLFLAGDAKIKWKWLGIRQQAD